MSRFQLRITHNSLCAGTIDNTPAPPQPPSESTPTMSLAQPESRQHPFDFDNQPQQPQQQPNETHLPQSDAEVLASAIDRVVKSNLLNKVKLWDPDLFDGSDTQKLHTFILQCKLNFCDRSDLFQDDMMKVNYMLSYLKGTALDCFEPALLEIPEPAWLSDFTLFLEELEASFGSYDPVSEAEAELEGLRMQENHQATKYFIKFMQLAARVQWGEAALLHQAYNGLAKHIKNDMVHHDKPMTLPGLRKTAQAIDTWYWERRAEVSRETNTATTSMHKSEKSDSSKTDAKSKGSSHSRQRNLPGSSQSKGSTSEPRKFIPNLTSKLGKDGKLTPQERQRRMDKNICLFCGTPGHVAKECPKSTSVASKARAVKTTQESASSSKPSGADPKKD